MHSRFGQFPTFCFAWLNGKPIMKLGTMNKVQLKEFIETTLFLHDKIEYRVLTLLLFHWKSPNPNCFLQFKGSDFLFSDLTDSTYHLCSNLSVPGTTFPIDQTHRTFNSLSSITISASLFPLCVALSLYRRHHNVFVMSFKPYVQHLPKEYLLSSPSYEPTHP